MDMLFTMNGILLGKKKFQRWEGEIVKSVVSMGGITEDPELEPPENADKEFEKVFEKAQQELTQDNIKEITARIYTGIIFGHMFADGNGRLARNVYAMMSTNQNPKPTTTTKRTIESGEFVLGLQHASYKSLIVEEGLDIEKYRDYVALKNGISTTDNDILKYIAARRVLKAKGKKVGETIEITELDEQTTEEFKKEYANVRKQFFWKTQETVEGYADWAIEILDTIVKN